MNDWPAVGSLISAQKEEVSKTATEFGSKPRQTQLPRLSGISEKSEETRFDSVTARRDEYLVAYEELRDALTARETLVGELETVEAEIAQRREASRDGLLGKLNAAQTDIDIGIDLKVGGDRTATIAYMRDSGFLTRDSGGHFRDKKIAERCCAMAKPTTVARALLASDASLFEADGVKLGSNAALSKDEATKLTDHFASFSVDADADVTVVKRDHCSRSWNFKRSRLTTKCASFSTRSQSISFLPASGAARCFLSSPCRKRLRW